MERRAERFKGYRADEIIGQPIFYPQEAKDSGWPEHELQVAKETGAFEDEGWRVRKDGSLFWANVVITALRDASGKSWWDLAIIMHAVAAARPQGLRRSQKRLDC